MITFLQFISEETSLKESVHPEVHNALLHHGFFRTGNDEHLYNHHSGSLAMADSKGNWAVGHRTLESGNGAESLKSHLHNAGIYAKDYKHKKVMAA